MYNSLFSYFFGASSGFSLQLHERIRITENSRFTESNGVVSGNVTKNNPYIISDWETKAITIMHTTAHFIIKNCKIYGERDTSSNEIFLLDTVNGTIEKVAINNSRGIFFSGSDNHIENCDISNCNHDIYLFKGSGNHIVNSGPVTFRLPSDESDNFVY